MLGGTPNPKMVVHILAQTDTWAGERVYRRLAAQRAISCAVPEIKEP